MPNPPLYPRANIIMKFPLTLLSCLLYLSLFSQNTERIEAILKIPRTSIERSELPQSNTITYLPTTYAGSTFDISSKLAMLNEATIIKVYYVYTKHRRSASFDQLELDRERLTWLNSVLPSVLADPLVQWEILEQTGCTAYEEGNNYFHGFIIIHRPVMTEQERIKEIERLSVYFESPTDVFAEPVVDPIDLQTPPADAGAATVLTTAEVNGKAQFEEGELELYYFLQKTLDYGPGDGRYDGWVDVEFDVNIDGTIDSVRFFGEYPYKIKTVVTNAISTMPPWQPAESNGKPITSTVRLQIRVSYSPDVNGMYTRDGQKPNLVEKDVVVIEVEEDENDFNLMTAPEALSVKTQAVYKGLELMVKSSRTALVMDVTGSMTVHIAGMKNWILSHPLNAPFTSYTFFNDGDNKTTKNKKIGETGGVYMTKVLDDMDKTIKEAMMKGSGGEAPESDMEAVLYAFEHDENADAVLLIADNYSEVRDISLLSNVGKPVHVLLCAAPKFVRCEYLKIAKQTGGLFILNGSFLDLSGLVKGSEIIIQGIKYKYDGTNFEMDYKGEIYY